MAVDPARPVSSRRLDLNVHQRVVLVVAYGLVVYLAWRWLDLRSARLDGDGGWFNYAPNSGVVFVPGSALQRNETLRVIVQACFVALWAVPSLYLLRTTRGAAEDGRSSSTRSDPSQPG